MIYQHNKWGTKQKGTEENYCLNKCNNNNKNNNNNVKIMSVTKKGQQEQTWGEENGFIIHLLKMQSS